MGCLEQLHAARKRWFAPRNWRYLIYWAASEIELLIRGNDQLHRSREKWMRQCEQLKAQLHDIEAHGGIPEVVQENAATAENNRALQAEVERLRENDEIGSASAHVLIESGIVPGFDPPCRCDECRLVAEKMADAGYLDRIKDRWWESAKPSLEQGQ